MFGMDANWGRIVAAAGRSGAYVDPDKIVLYFGFTNRMQVLSNGQPTNFNRKAIKKYMKDSLIKVLINLNLGKYSATAWGTDISYEYVRINAEYST